MSTPKKWQCCESYECICGYNAEPAPTRIVRIKDLAILTSITDAPEGDVRSVDGYGLYRFTRRGDDWNYDLPWQVDTGAGHWIHVAIEQARDALHRYLAEWVGGAPCEGEDAITAPRCGADGECRRQTP